MATGRMLQKKISNNKSLPKMIALLDDRMGHPHGAMAALLYTWCISHLDVDGRMHGDPIVVKGNVVPRISFITAEYVETYLLAMQEVGLVAYYEANDDRWLEFPGFGSAQPGLRRDREPKSNVPPPNTGKRIERTALPADIRHDAGKDPASIRQTSGSDPADCPEVSRGVSALTAGEKKGIERKGREDIHTRAREADEPDDEFKVQLDALVAAWRGSGLPLMVAGDQLQLLCARLADGVSVEDFPKWCAGFKRLTDGWRANNAPNCGATPLLMLGHLDKVELVLKGELNPFAKPASARDNRPGEVSPRVMQTAQQLLAKRKAGAA